MLNSRRFSRKIPAVCERSITASGRSAGFCRRLVQKSSLRGTGPAVSTPARKGPDSRDGSFLRASSATVTVSRSRLPQRKCPQPELRAFPESDPWGFLWPGSLPGRRYPFGKGLHSFGITDGKSRAGTWPRWIPQPGRLPSSHRPASEPRRRPRQRRRWRWCRESGWPSAWRSRHSPAARRSR